jgi:zinc transport system substrate-binding protein
MNRKLISSTLLILLSIPAGVGLTGCLDTGDSGSERVVVTILPQLEMVRSIGGDSVEVVVMVPAGESPHSYEPRPSQLIGVSRSKIYFKVGSGVDFELSHLDTIMEQTTNMDVVDCSEGVELLSYDEHYGGAAHSEDDHGGGDPHIWLSPGNMKKMAGNVLEGFIDRDPENEDSYRQRYDDYISRLDSLSDELETILSPYEGRKFLTYHPSWGYFGDDFNLTQISIEEEGKQPGPQGVNAIIEQARAEKIKVIFIEPQFDRSSAEEIANEIGGDVVVVDPLAPDYMENLKHVGEEMADGFGS